uniref:WH1 domain-containing protein n=2 Tax=Strongyloides stercoralis TaxID=6248 RepID=A0A0K0DV62_STRER
MSESILAQATAQIYLFDRSTKRWITPDGLDTSNDPQSANQLAQILLLHNAGKRSFRIVGMQRDGRGIIIETKLFARIKYQKANETFHQWRDEQRQVFGVNFADNYEASIFYQNVVKVLNSIEDNPNIDPGGDLYQDPAVITNGRLGVQQQNGMMNGNNSNYINGMNYDADQDSITSSNSHSYLNSNSQMTTQIQAMNNASVLRKPSYVIPQQQSNPNLVAQQNQRRASQGSSGSSTHSSTNYSAPFNGTSSNGTNIARNVPAPPPPPPPNVSSKSSCTTTSNPPPPPPPPLPVNLKTENKGNSLVDQLKKTQLKKVNSVEGNGTTQTTPKSNINANKGDLLSELAAKITKRKNQEEIKSNESSDSNNICDKKSSETLLTNGILAQNNSNISLRSWKQTTSNGDINTTNGVDSPKTHRKIPSVSSLSSQEDPLNKNINQSTAQVTLADLERHKQDVLSEVQKKLQSFKLEIVQEVVAAIRNELRS